MGGWEEVGEVGEADEVAEGVGEDAGEEGGGAEEEEGCLSGRVDGGD